MHSYTLEEWIEDLQRAFPGWIPILVRLSEQLKETDPEAKFGQIKEKFGSLRIYSDYVLSWQGARSVSQAERDSSATCQECGLPGELRTQKADGGSFGWHLTLCEIHAREMGYKITETHWIGRHKIVNVHEENAGCHEHGCSMHNPSKEALAIGSRHWRGDRGLMERICKHGVGHPDPDHINFVRRTQGDEAAKTESVHGCDGCCMSPEQREELGLNREDE